LELLITNEEHRSKLEGMVLILKRHNCHCEEPWAKSKGTKQS